MKNIVLCSDGTGNAGGKANGTNVWRLHQAIDLSTGDQVAFHDDGVGTHENKIVKAIGGAFGWGLSENIKNLYTSLVRVYREDDQIFIFGFSRGAFTARALAGLITKYGVLDRYKYATPGDLDAAVDELFKCFRRGIEFSKDRKEKGTDAGAREQISSFCGRKKQSHSLLQTKVTFLGVWDTVDAIGVPFDWMRDLIYTTGLVREYDHDYNADILRSAHAIAIDDQRTTFHPLMLSEPEDAKAGTPDAKVVQVWFAGMHSNVGGSYPKDELSLMPLVWMMERAEKASSEPARALRFVESVKSRYEDTANALGTMYDSRAGLASYYRFKPRNLIQACVDARITGGPIIHESVFARIAHRTAGYSPANIPRNYQVWKDDKEKETIPEVAKDPEVVKGPEEEKDPEVVKGTVIPERVEMTDLASKFASYRVALYYAFMVFSLALVATSLILGVLHVADPMTDSGTVISFLMAVVSFLVPDMLGHYAETVVKHWWWAAFFAGVFGMLHWIRGWLLTGTREIASIGWRYQALFNLDSEQGESRPKEERDRLLETISCLKGNFGKALGYAWIRRGWKRSIVLLGIFGTLIIVGVVLIQDRFKTDFHMACAPIGTGALLDESANTVVTKTRNPCASTGWEVAANQPIFVRVEATQ